MGLIGFVIGGCPAGLNVALARDWAQMKRPGLAESLSGASLAVSEGGA